MTSIIHDVGVQFFSGAFSEAKMRQQETSGKLPWRWGQLLRSRLENGSFKQVTRSASKYVADITVQDLFNDTLFILELALVRRVGMTRSLKSRNDSPTTPI
jgi:hypothetical protein